MLTRSCHRNNWGRARYAGAGCPDAADGRPDVGARRLTSTIRAGDGRDRPGVAQ
ncbi:hypothetical protein [Gordonia sp. NPDC058843]|uniref:hypothetical protein n=1 Tax=Gordonia sp. NPDC058843 TaxID=3346648 RepID=UPI003674F2FD